MAKLDARQRAELPDSAFAYVDGKGTRRLPIHDEAHLRSALSRFNQVRFESTEARQKAFRKVLTTAVEYGIAPVGFVAAQMRIAQEADSPNLPQGPVTFLISDIEGSTALLTRLGDEYASLLERVRGLIGGLVDSHHGCEVDARADEYFAVFPQASDALAAAIEIQREMAKGQWSEPVKVRIGLHSGTPARTETGYVGLAVNAVSRISNAGHGGQVLASTIVRDELGGAMPDGVVLSSLGAHRLRGLPDEVELFQVEAAGMESSFPPLRFTEGSDDRSG
jgi:class 3 adenylate cyclase